MTICIHFTRYVSSKSWSKSKVLKDFFCIGFISTVSANNRGYNNYFIVLSQKYHTTGTDVSRPITIIWQRVNQFLRWTTLYIKTSIWQGASTTNLKSLVWLKTWSNQEPPTANALQWGYRAWQLYMCLYKTYMNS